ncbi:hypothetical protein N752_01090 [Desulforamulus aquiferis]|nr:hypothetical protein [Desulforamulus aquiferis]RYD07210.1 hypothetical protein N752_01090 [Desulforamulus aquiferis]
MQLIKTKNESKGKKKNILLATGDEAVNEAISTSVSHSFNIAEDREGLLQKVNTTKTDVVVVSKGLPGDVDILEVLQQVKKHTENVIFIAGNISPTDITIARIKELGIEIITGDISIGHLMKSLHKSLGQADEQHPISYESDDTTALDKIVRAGSELAKNIPNISVPKVPTIQIKRKKQSICKKLVAIASPIPAGKTFVAVNLSTVLWKMRYNVVLVDAAIQQSTHTWLGVPHEGGLLEALQSDDPLSLAYQRPEAMMPKVNILNTSAFDGKANIKDYIKLLNNLNETEEVDIILVDTQGNMNDLLTKTILDMAGQVILVADQDFNHLMFLQSALDKLENSLDFDKFSLIINRVIDSNNLGISDAEKAAGLQADGVIPDQTKEVLESIKNGIPAALFCSQIRESLEDFWNKTQQMQALA